MRHGLGSCVFSGVPLGMPLERHYRSQTGAALSIYTKPATQAAITTTNSSRSGDVDAPSRRIPVRSTPTASIPTDSLRSPLHAKGTSAALGAGGCCQGGSR